MSEEPWLAKQEWADRRIEDVSTKAAGCFLAFALGWTLVSSGIAATVLSQGDGLGGFFFVLIFPAVGLLLVGVGINMMLRRRRFGIPVLELATLPGVPGETFAGMVRTTGTIDPVGGFRVRLHCLRRTVSGSGKNRRTDETTLWEHEEVMPGATRRADGIAIPVAIPLPADARETDESDSSNQVLWRLEVGAAVTGIDFKAQFEVPVFRTSPATPGREP